MSDLLNQASLVMVPSGYKEDTVYSVVPSDGSGDMAFTRASNGTRVNSAGLVEVAPWNMLSNSEQFTSANGWFANITGSSTASQTSDYGIAPNGTTTADRIQLALNGSSFADWVVVPTTGIIVGQVYTYSIYIKSLSGTKIIKFFNDNSVNVLKTITTEWVRYEYTWTASNATIYPRFLIDDAGATSTTADLLAWGFQINSGSTAKPYFPTTDRLNVPRLTYQNGGGGCPSLLLEKQSTNLLSYSQDFSNGFWNKTNVGTGDVAVVTPNYAISPDGTQNASRLVCNLNGGTTAGTRSWMLANFTAQATVTISIWIKLNSAGTKTVLLSDSGGGSKTISGTDWQRIDATFVGAGGEFRIGLIGGSTSDTLDCCIWGAQAESGSYPTSYIPTTSSSATRVADACSKTGISSLIGASEGTFFVDAEVNFNANFTILASLQNTAGAFSNAVYWYVVNNTLEAAIWTTPQFTGWVQPSSALTNGRHKVALAWKANDFAYYLDGVQVAVSTSFSAVPSGMSKIDLANYVASYQSDQKFNEVVVFPTRLTNAELASLTTI